MPRSQVFASTLGDATWLRRVYVCEGRNAAQVAKLLGCSRQAVHGALRRFGISMKSAGDAQKLATTATTAAFVDTLRNPAWLEGQIASGPPLSQIASAAGCVPSSALHALERAGLVNRWRALRQRNVAARRARPRLPPGTCALCDRPGLAVVCKDGGLHSNAPENLERLCHRHHRQQRALEHTIALEVLQALGVPRAQIRNAARKRLTQERNMVKDSVNSQDTVSVGLERAPAKEAATRTCPKCGSIAVPHAEPGQWSCTSPGCATVFRPN